jgi:hypothetical protein
MIPIADRPVRVPEEKIAFEICSNDADVFPAPPRRTKWPPVGVPNEQSDDHGSRIMPKGPALVQSRMGEVNRFRLLCHCPANVLPFSGERQRDVRSYHGREEPRA